VKQEEMMNLAEVLSESSRKYREKPAVLFEGRPYTFLEIDEEIRRRAAWLRNLGVTKGDRVALQVPKSMEFIFIHLAVLSLGAITLPLNPDYASEEVHYYLTDSGASLFINDANGFQRNRELKEKISGIRVYLLDGTSSHGLGPLSSDLAKVGARDPRTYAAQDDDTAMILYTSGTTGRSKGAMITHRNLVTNMIALEEAWEWTNRDRLLHVLPLIHVHGLSVALQGSLYTGSTVIMHEKFDPARTWKAIAEEKCTMLMAVPTIYHRLVGEWEKMNPDLRSMRVFISGSAPLSENLFHRFEEATKYRILERYGMTEAGMITSNPIDVSGRKAKSVGYPLPGVQARVATEKGLEVKPGDVGEVRIKGDNVFKGYWEMPDKTRESFEGGWFKTGDLGFQDPADRMRLYLVGRAKELIITGGYNVYPKEIENVLERHGAVHEAAVIGLPDEDYGERVAAVVVLKKGEKPSSSEEIIRYCKEHLAGYKCPKQVYLIDQIPRNTMGKIQKNILQKKYSDR
jgi:malonyl-CoA/methylmalonyl-CoA synthetase